MKIVASPRLDRDGVLDVVSPVDSGLLFIIPVTDLSLHSLFFALSSPLGLSRRLGFYSSYPSHSDYTRFPVLLFLTETPRYYLYTIQIPPG